MRSTSDIFRPAAPLTTMRVVKPCSTRAMRACTTASGMEPASAAFACTPSINGARNDQRSHRTGVMQNPSSSKSRAAGCGNRQFGLKLDRRLSIANRGFGIDETDAGSPAQVLTVQARERGHVPPPRPSSRSRQEQVHLRAKAQELEPGGDRFEGVRHRSHRAATRRRRRAQPASPSGQPDVPCIDQSPKLRGPTG